MNKREFFLNQEKFGSGFTIIELIVTISIIVLMAVLAFPAFSKYQKKAELVQKAEELNGYINEMNVLVKNPEPGVDSYEMIIIKNGSGLISKIDFIKNTSNVPIRTLTYDTDQNLKLETLSDTDKITCSVKDANCCVIVLNACASTNESKSRFWYYDRSIKWQVIIDIKNSPFNTSFSVTPM